MNRLPMNFDWRKAKQNVPYGNTFHQILRQHPQQTAGELAESILSHAQLRVLKTDNPKHIEQFKQYGSDAYKYVIETFVKTMVLPYYNTHKLDSDQLLYIAKNIQSTPSDMPLNEAGLQTEAIIQDGVLYIHPQIVVKAISDVCF